MDINVKCSISILLVLLAGLFAVLANGNFLETRSLFQISPLLLATFHALSTSLWLLSLALSCFIFTGKRWAFGISILCAASYLAIYTLNLGTLFSVSSTPIYKALLMIEMLGLVASVFLIILSIQGTRTAQR